MSLAGQRILVTGASSGLGRAVTLKLAGQGAEIIAVARRRERLQALVEARPDLIIPCPLDLTCIHDIKAASGDWHDLNGAILNAGVTQYGPFSDGDVERDTAMVETNVTANVVLARQLIPNLAPQARILFVGSLGGLTPLPYQAVYSGTKAFITNFALALRTELADQDISVGVFAPGGIETEMTDDPALDRLRGSLQGVDQVADALISAYSSRKGLVVPGTANKSAAAAFKVLPRSLVSKIIKRVYSR